MRFQFTGFVVIILIFMGCICGCTQLFPSEPHITPSVTHQQSQPTLFPTVPTPFGPPSLTWYLISIKDGNSTVRVIPETTITAFFDGQGTVSGTSGCNQYTASYAGSQKNLIVGSPAFTRIDCKIPAGIMTQESLYLTRIQETRTYSVEGILKLIDDKGDVILTYTQIPTLTPVPAPLNATIWYVNSFVDATGQVRSPRGLTTIRLAFAADGHLYGNAGCNNHYGPYQKTNENSISIADQKTTRIHCGIAGVMELEKAYLATLPKMTRYSISGDTLLLSDADGNATIESSTKFA